MDCIHFHLYTVINFSTFSNYDLQVGTSVGTTDTPFTVYLIRT